MKQRMFSGGFTLIEVLLVVVIIAILAGIVIVAVNPGKQISTTNNAERKAHVQSISNAIAQYSIDNRGALPASITNAALVMGNAAGKANICATLVPTYIAAMPFDATAAGAHYASCADYDTGYTVVNNGGRVTVAAPAAELGAVISVTR